MFNFLPNDKILDRFKLKAIADDRINVTEKLKFALGRAEKFLDRFKLNAFADDRINVIEKLKFALGRVQNMVGKNAGYQHFFLFPQCFQQPPFSGLLKVGIFMVKSSPSSKKLDWSKFKAFVGDKFKVAKMMISLVDSIENIVGKGEKAGYQHFLLFPHDVFKRLLSWGH